MNMEVNLKPVEVFINWIGAIPHNWEYRRLKYVALLNTDILPENTDPLYEMEYIDIGSVTYEHGITRTEKFRFSEAPSRARRLVQEGDTIISTVRTYLKAIAAIKEPPENLIVSTGFTVVRPNEIMDSRFLGYSLQSKMFVDSVMASSDGVSYPAINSSRLATLPVALPKFEEQQTIAQFLDHKTALIDQYIANKQRQIQLLEKLRTSIISEAVTQGLNPDVEMKDSGGKWLGKVPMHWQTYRLRFLLQFNPSKSEVQKLRIENALVTFLPMENVSESGEVNLSDTAKISDVWDGYTYCRNGDVILAKITPCYENGKGAYLSNLVNDVAFGSTEFIVMRPSRDILGKFLYFLTITELFRDMGESQMQGSAGQQRVPLRFLKDFLLWLPNITEQKAIIEYIELETKKVETLIDQLTQQITKMEAYRTSLISEAVTGKIDVRDFKLSETEVSTSQNSAKQLTDAAIPS